MVFSENPKQIQRTLVRIPGRNETKGYKILDLGSVSRLAGSISVPRFNQTSAATGAGAAAAPPAAAAAQSTEKEKGQTQPPSQSQPQQQHQPRQPRLERRTATTTPAPTISTTNTTNATAMMEQSNSSSSNNGASAMTSQPSNPTSTTLMIRLNRDDAVRLLQQPQNQFLLVQPQRPHYQRRRQIQQSRQHPYENISQLNRQRLSSHSYQNDAFQPSPPTFQNEPSTLYNNMPPLVPIPSTLQIPNQRVSESQTLHSALLLFPEFNQLSQDGQRQFISAVISSLEGVGDNG